MDPAIYLFSRGNCLEAMTHYAEVLGGRLGPVFRNADAPDAESRMSGGDDLVMNMSMTLGRVTVMASDNSEGMYDKPQGFRVSIPATSRQEFDRIFGALAKDAEAVEMAPEETFWAERFAMFTDRFGMPWMLSFDGDRVEGTQS